MFGVIADALCSIITILFPIFASYKALRTSDPGQLSPWLMYWVVLSSFLLVESWTVFILGWIPFYSWIRLFLLSYLVLPQTQGAKLLYSEYIHPFISRHETEIDNFISNAHDRARVAGLQYFKQAIEFIRVNVLGLPASEPPSPPSTSHGSYAQSLLSRFNLPSARDGLAAPASDIYSLVSSALGQAMAGGGTKELQAEEMSASGTLIPPNISSNAEKMSYIAQQRDRLRVLLSAFDKEANSLASSSNDRSIETDVEQRMRDMETKQGDGLKKSKSEMEFEPIEHEDTGTELQGKAAAARKTSGGSWTPWAWGVKPDSKPEHEVEHGSSSGVNLEH